MRRGGEMDIDPWRALPKPGPAAGWSALRVEHDQDWNFFWIRDSENRVGLTLQYRETGSDFTPTPRLWGVEVTRASDGPDTHLTFKLTDPSNSDLFLRLCSDIVSSTYSASSEREAARVALQRAWRWHHLLRGGGSDLLSLRAQKGLIGELFFLEELVLPAVGPSAAIRSWVGPLDAPKDFEIGRMAMEAKATSSVQAGPVKISSVEQLDPVPHEKLFLSVVEIVQGSADDANSLTLTDVVERVRRVVALEGTALEEYEAKLVAAGFSQAHAYGSTQWLIGPSRTFMVADGFPRLLPKSVPADVSCVRYDLSLESLGKFALGRDDVVKQLSGIVNG